MKNNKYWFKPKTYGYGVQPSSWEGVLATFGLIGALMLIAAENGFFSENVTEKNTLIFLIETAIITSLFLYAVRNKVEGKLGWRWGKRRKK